MTRFLPFGSRSKTIQVNTFGGGGGGVPRSGLVAEYLLATNSLDTSGNGYNGTDTNMTYSAGSAVFNGSAYISYGNILNFTGADPFSISFVGTFNSTGTTFIIAKSLASGSFGGYGVQFNTGQIEFYIVSNDGSLGRIEKLYSALSTGVKYHIVCTYDGSKLGSGVNMYINNVLTTGTLVFDTFTGKSSNTTASFQIGSRDGGNLPMNGNLNKARIYNRVLNAGEIAALYAEG